MPKDNYGYGSGYTVNGSGTNSSGNHWCSRSGDNGSSGYHYSNSDGGYYYNNPNGSTYYQSSKGSTTYTSPSGQVYKGQK
ncbi:hypothetical protein BDY19DRAFT_991708 [Irpex rosettiformis]|uniref:Uncharacterized protein n=1 Tax=Irpex rosettiformis TaxID=378272 RepID=A0ACB8U9Y3_9APHY|nr:hypothetical protein BDY19DRAFT_991708 [Irpex rosettiformis]